MDPKLTDAASQAQKDTLTAADWTLILGNNPEQFDYTGIDPHMVESYNQRTNVPVPPNGFPVADQSQPTGTDPISGREWQTDSTAPEHQGLLVDREYACIFKLDAPRDCSDAATTADPTLLDSCDCQPPSPETTGSFTPAEVPAVCDDCGPHHAGLGEGVPDDPRARARAPSRAGHRRQRGHHLVALSDSYGGHEWQQHATRFTGTARR